MKKIRFTLLAFLILTLTNILTAQKIPNQLTDAMQAFDNGEFVKAYNIFKNFKDDNNVESYVQSVARFYSAECLANLKSLDGAATEFEEFLDNHKYSLLRKDALYKLGIIYYDLKIYMRSRARLNRLLEEYPNDEISGSALYWIGQAYLAEDNFTSAEEFLREAIAKKSNNNFIDYSIYSLANLYEETKDYQNAVSYYTQILDYYSTSELAPYSQLRIGICYFNLKEYDNAVLELSDPQISELPDESQNEAKLILANAFFRLKEFENASEAYTSILAKYPAGIEADQIKYGLAWISFQMYNYDSAYNEFSELAEESVDSIKINSLFWSGECKRYAGETDGALEIYRKFLELYPEHKLSPKVKLNMSLIYFNEDDIAKAERNLIGALDSDDYSTHARAYVLLGEISLNKKDYEGAVNYFKRSLEVKEISSEHKNRAILGLGISQYYLGSYNDAVMNLMDINVREKRFERDKVNFFLAESYFEKGDYKSAIKHYTRVGLANNELERDVLYGKAYAYFNSKDFDNAIYYLNEFAQKYKNDKEVYDVKLRLADSHYATKNFYQASKIYREVYRSKNSLLNSGYAYFQYSQALFQSGDYKNAISNLNKLQQKFSKSRYADEAQRLIGWIHFKQNDYRNAISNFEKLFITYPKSDLKPSAYYLIGDSYYNMGLYDTAITYYNTLIYEFPNTNYVFDAVNGIQYCYLAKDEPENAVLLINQFVNDNKDSKYADQILLKKGEIYVSLGESEKAKMSYAEYIEKFPKGSSLAKAYLGLAESASELKEKEFAIQNYKTLISNFPKTDEGISGVISLGQIYLDDKDFASAILNYDNSIKANKESIRIPELMYLKSLALINAGDLEGAYANLEYVSSYYDESLYAAKSKLELGLLEMVRKNYENAETLFMGIAETRTDDLGAQGQYYYGMTLYEQDKIDDAISALVRVRSVFNTYDEWYSKSLILLGDCYIKLKEYKKAKEMFKAVIKKHKNDEIGKEANKKLKTL
ncbi:MAG: tetratricopeptide repeat protein [Melioribacteraceae bacterium]|nr:tetratricopeptide repeat protein [Melioribacteraceae bacterium]